jgi:hypothetical protein
LTPPRPLAGGIGWSHDLVVVEGDAPAALALAEIRGSTATWVVIRRHPGPIPYYYYYVFTCAEVLAMAERVPPGTDLDLVALTQALDLREEHRSTAVAARSALPVTSVSGRPNANLPSVLRYVEANDAGWPAAVGGADVQRRGAVSRGRQLVGAGQPAPEARNTGGTGRLAEYAVRDELPAGGAEPAWVNAAPDFAGPHCGSTDDRRPAPEAVATPKAVAPLPAGAAAEEFPWLKHSLHFGASSFGRFGPNTDHADVPADEGVTPVRFPTIEPEEPPVPGNAIALMVDLLRRPSTTTAGGPLRLGDLAPAWSTLTLAVTLACPGIEFDGGGSGTVTIRRNDSSLPARITGRVHAGLEPGSRLDVVALFYDGTRFCGNALRQLTVLAPAPEANVPPREMAAGAISAAPTATAPEVAPTALPGTVGIVAVEPTAERPDLTIVIWQMEPSTPGKLTWFLTPTERFDGLPPVLDGVVNLGHDPAKEAKELFTEFAALERGRHRSRIEGFGEKLWQRAPAAFRDAYWAMWDRYRRPLTIQFVSGEPYLPWELVRPSRTRKGQSETHPPLAFKHSVARWLLSWNGYMRNRLPSGRLFTISPHYKSAARGLRRAEAESAALTTRFGAARVPATFNAVKEFLERVAPRDPVAILHFAGHGSFAAAEATSSKIELEDGALTVSDVDRSEVQLGVACRTLVFFNACEVGATGSVLGAVGGWADAFLGRQFGGFIAPLWAVDDDDAATVTSELLEGILTRREPVGAVLRGIRERYGDVSPTFFSYLYYGDVTARLAPRVSEGQMPSAAP